jgi:hypothetical protein
MWKQIKKGGLDAPLMPQWIQSKDLVGAQGAKLPKACEFSAFQTLDFEGGRKGNLH